MENIEDLPENKHFTKFSEIEGFYPVIKQGQGIFTLLLTRRDDAFLIRRSIKNTLLNIARESAVDIVAARKKARRITGKGHEVPLPLEPGRILVPLRVFHAQPGGEGVLGYFILDIVREVSRGETPGFASCLTLTGNRHIDLISSPATVERQLALARLLQNEYWRHNGDRSEGCSANSSANSSASLVRDASANYLPLILAELSRLGHSAE